MENDTSLKQHLGKWMGIAQGLWGEAWEPPFWGIDVLVALEQRIGHACPDPWQQLNLPGEDDDLNGA